MTTRADLRMLAALVRRSANELLRVPGAAIPGVLAPTVFFLGITSVFGHLTQPARLHLDSFQSFMIPVSLLQGAGVHGRRPGRQPRPRHRAGWFDRLLASPAPRRCCSPRS